MEMIASLGGWAWIALGVVLMALEVAAPGAFMLWFGLAALATGLLVFVLPLSWEWALLVFALCAVVCVLIGRWLGRSSGPAEPEPLLNKRGAALIGRTLVLEEPVEQGRGRVRIDDTIWRVEGPDLPAGQRIRVAGVDGALLRIEPQP